jgi:hypothetical protein
MSKYPARLTFAGLLVDRPGQLKQLIPWRIVQFTNKNWQIPKSIRKADPTLPSSISLPAMRTRQLVAKLHARQLRRDLANAAHEMYWKPAMPWYPILMFALFVAELPGWAKVETFAILGGGLVLYGTIFAVVALTGIHWLISWFRIQSVKTTSHGIEITNRNGKQVIYAWTDFVRPMSTIVPFRLKAASRSVIFVPSSIQAWRYLLFAVWLTPRKATAMPLSATSARRLLLLTDAVIPLVLALSYLGHRDAGILFAGALLMLMLNGGLFLMGPSRKHILNRIDRYFERIEKKCYESRREVPAAFVRY